MLPSAAQTPAQAEILRNSLVTLGHATSRFTDTIPPLAELRTLRQAREPERSSYFAYDSKTGQTGFFSVIKITSLVHKIIIEMHRAAGMSDRSNQGLQDASRAKRLSAARAMAELADQAMKELDRPGSDVNPKDCLSLVNTVSRTTRRFPAHTLSVTLAIVALLGNSSRCAYRGGCGTPRRDWSVLERHCGPNLFRFRTLPAARPSHRTCDRHLSRSSAAIAAVERDDAYRRG